MPKRIIKTARHREEHFHGHHRFEHCYVDSQVYFITARCRDRYPAFASDEAKAVFWDRFDHWTRACGFTPWVTSLIDNHYHTLGYNRTGDQLMRMMQCLHGSVAKRVNDVLPERRSDFWRDHRGRGFMDGCNRDERQARRAYRYTLTPCRRHGVCDDWREYPHTCVNVEVERAIRRSVALNAFMRGVPYQRYEKRR
ncbi:MAG: hypothetical protein GVY24_05020 [Planctomycetes bacterium]|jgi:REP element-mobilizing transposase RayT|nr:hypothetical protein [Planctomycetota bacterium]